MPPRRRGGGKSSTRAPELGEALGVLLCPLSITLRAARAASPAGPRFGRRRVRTSGRRRLIRFTNTRYLQGIRPYFTNVNSYYDNRGQREFLHYDLNASGTEVCVSAYQRNSATAPWINSHTYAVYLANSSGC